MATLLFATLGSLGDIKPLIAIAAHARQAGHRVLFATSPAYQRIIETNGLRYESFGSDAFFESLRLRKEILDPRIGFATFMNHANLLALEELYARLYELGEGVDVIVATPLVAVAHLVAWQRRVPLINCALSPAMLFGDRLAKEVDPYRREWRARLNALRARLGAPSRSFPQMERFAADLTLGIYPLCLSVDRGQSIRDRCIRSPAEVGYPILNVRQDPSEHLDRWMRGGPFALISFGSFIDRDAERCFHVTTAACRKAGMRCLYVSPHSAGKLNAHGAPDIRIEPFLEHSHVMPRASVIVHHGGTGTLAASLQAERPTVVAPYGLDQTFNARRLEEEDLATAIDLTTTTANDLGDALTDAIVAWPRRSSLLNSFNQGIGGQASARAVARIEALLAMPPARPCMP